MERNKGVLKLALGGILLAFTIVFMFAGSFAPGVEITLYSISGFFIGIMILESGPRAGVILYAAAIILGFVILPNKLGMIPYACLFGIYGIIKYYIEKIKMPVIQVILKIVFFAGILTLGLVFFKELLLGNVSLPDVSIWIIIPCGVAFLMLYDWIYTQGLNIYLKRVKRKKVPQPVKLWQGDK
ncbi:MAG: hypothetical protein RR361_07005, partial [Anaerovorax sp.]